MSGISKTRMQVLQTICEFLKSKGAAPIDLKELEKMGIDYETAKNYVSIIEHTQRYWARIYIHDSDKEGEGSFAVESEYGKKRDEIQQLLRQIIDMFGADETPEWEEREPSLRTLLFRELNDVIRTRFDRTKVPVSIELPKKEFRAILYCDICGLQRDFPYHCEAGPLQFSTEKHELYCDVCGFQSSIPKHCGEYMSGEYYVGGESLAFVRVKDES